MDNLISTMIFMALASAGIIGYARFRRMARELDAAMRELDELHAHAAAQSKRLAARPIEPQPTPQRPAPSYSDPTPTYIDYTPLAGAGNALAKPPSDLRTTLQHLARLTNGRRYSIPLGWTSHGLYTACLVGDVNHILITGQSNAGKDNATMGQLLALALNHSPKELQIGIIDGKGLDWLGWAGKQHTWLLADEPEKIAAAMGQITDERRRRRGILANAGCASWDEYQGGDLPLLVVFISELSLLEDATKARELGAWLNSELAAGRAFGMRFIIATQNASNFDTRWRGQISLFMAGFQPSRSADEPNTGMLASDLEAIGAIPPSKLIAPPDGSGVFSVAQAPKAATLRVPLLASQHRRWLLDQLPNKTLHSQQPAQRPAASQPANGLHDDNYLAALLAGQPASQPAAPSSTAMAPIQAENSEVAASSATAVLSAAASQAIALPVVDGVDQSEVQRIAEAARSAKSRRALCQELYNGATGGAHFNRVTKVCDALGLLVPAARSGQQLAA